MPHVLGILRSGERARIKEKYVIKLPGAVALHMGDFGTRESAENAGPLSKGSRYGGVIMEDRAK